MTEEAPLPSRKSSTRLHSRPVRHSRNHSSTKLNKLGRTNSTLQLTKLSEGRSDSQVSVELTSSATSSRNEKPPPRPPSVARLKVRGPSSHRPRHLASSGAISATTASSNGANDNNHSTGSYLPVKFDVDDGADFQDTDTEEDSSTPKSKSLRHRVFDHHNSSTISLGIHPVEPTPAQISNETVVSVTSMADMANALSLRRPESVFVTDGDLLSKAISKSQSVADLHKIVGNSSSRINNRMRLKQQMPHEVHANGAETVPNSDKRLFEKIFRGYINAKSLKNPVMSSLDHVFARSLERTPEGAGLSSNLGSNKLPIGLVSKKTIGSLSATTYNQMADLSLDSRETSFGGHTSSVHLNGLSSYMLQKMWTQGWIPHEQEQELETEQVESVASQAKRVNMQLHNQIWTGNTNVTASDSRNQDHNPDASSGNSGSAVSTSPAKSQHARNDSALRRPRPAAPDAIRLA